MALMPENFHQRNDKRIMRQLENGKTLKLPNKFGQILTLLMTSWCLQMHSLWKHYMLAQT